MKSSLFSVSNISSACRGLQEFFFEETENLKTDISFDYEVLLFSIYYSISHPFLIDELLLNVRQAFAKLLYNKGNFLHFFSLCLFFLP